jgi:hypothetical protein
MEQIIPKELIERKIFFVRGQKVILDFHLASLYGISTKRLKEQVRRNLRRFPPDFMFELNQEEFNALRSHFATSKSGRGGTRYRSYAFTEQGVAMLSSILSTNRAIDVNISIMRAFVKLRDMIATNKELARKLEDIEKKYDSQFKIVFEAIRKLMQPPEKPKRQIGFRVEEPKPIYHARKRK